MMKYGVAALGVARFEVKIGLDNTASRAMFEGLGFELLSESHVFQEATLSCRVQQDAAAAAAAGLGHYSERRWR